MDFTIRRSGHVVLGVTDAEREKRFLEEVIGFRCVANIGPFYFLTGNPLSNHHMIAVRAFAKPSARMPDPARQVGMISASYELADFEAVRRLFDLIQRSGPEFGARIVDVRRRKTMSTVVCADPDGNWLEFYCFEPQAEGGPELRSRLAATPAAAVSSAGTGIRGTSHLNLRVGDVERSRRFYEDLLGLSPIGVDGYGRYYLAGKADSYRPQLALEHAADDAPRSGVREAFGFDHYSLELSSFDDLCNAYRRLCDAGVHIHHTVDHGVTNSVYFTDPDDNLMELYHDVPRAEYENPLAPFRVETPSLEHRLVR